MSTRRIREFSVTIEASWQCHHSMMGPSDDLDPTRLAVHSEWLRRLARRLVHDAALAEDVAQETLLVALERAPAAASEDGLRAWLHNVARNLARLQRRGDGRRAARERAHGDAARAHAPAAADVVARAAEQRRLIDAVLALDEPYRTAVLLAYEERLKPAEVARRTGVSPEATRKRISRGLALLRARLEPRGPEDRRDWLAGLTLVARAPDAAVLPWTLSLAMTTKWTVSALVCAALIALGFIVLDRPRATGHGPSEVATITREAPVTVSAEDVRHVASAQATRTQVPRDVDAVVLDAPRRLRGRVLLTDERAAIVGATVRAARESTPTAGDPEGPVLATTDASGLFEIALTESVARTLTAGGLWVEHPDAFDVHVAGAVIAHAGDGLLELRTVLEGEVVVRVRTPDGGPVEDAEVHYSLTPTVGSEAQVWRYHRDVRAGTTDTRGELRVVGVPVATAVWFKLRDEFYSATRLVIDSITRQAEVELTPFQWASITAQLVHVDGAPASDVRVRWRGAAEPSGSSNTFAADTDEAGRVVLHGLGDGPGVFEVLIESDRHWYHAPVHARLGRGEVRDLGTLVLEPLVTVAGRVTDGGDDTDVPSELRIGVFRDGALVTTGRVDGDHRFVVESPAGTVVVGAYDSGLDGDPRHVFRGRPTCERVVVAPARDVVLSLAAARAALVGSMDEGVEDVELRLFPTEPEVSFVGTPTYRRGSAAPATEPGALRFVDLEPGPARAFVCAADGRSGDLGEVMLRAGDVTDVGNVRFASARLAVRVVGAPPGAAATVTVMPSSRVAHRATCDADGRASFELPVGPYGIRAEALGRSTGAWRCAWVGAASSGEVVLSLGELAELTGTISGPDGPLRDVVVQAQRSRPPSNASSAATTDADGRFVFQPLEPGIYRYWVGVSLTGQVELAHGAQRELALTLGMPETRIEVEEGGARAGWVKGLRVASSIGLVWQMGRARAAGGGSFSAELPEGALVFELDPGALVREQQVLVPGPAAAGAEYVLALPSTGIELRLSGAAAHRPDPRATLESLGGASARSSWGTAPTLLIEQSATDEPNGARIVRIPYLTPGSIVAVQGFTGDGRVRTERVTVGAEGWTRVDWE
jgi:RNA polymerase sigma factor (sigma-70 family)